MAFVRCAHSRFRKSMSYSGVAVILFPLEFNNVLNMWFDGGNNKSTAKTLPKHHMNVEKFRINSLIQSILDIPLRLLNLNIITNEMSFGKICKSLDFEMHPRGISCAFYPYLNVCARALSLLALEIPHKVSNSNSFWINVFAKT